MKAAACLRPMYKVCFVLGDLGDPGYARVVAGVVAGALVAMNELYLRAYLRTPPSSSSGVRYHDASQGRKRPGRAYVQDVLTCLREGYASSWDLACWTVAELRARGASALPVVDARRVSGGLLVRILVGLPDGAVLDPSEGRGGILLRPRQRLTFVSGLFEEPRDRKISDATLQILCDALAAVDEEWLRRHPSAPRIYDVPEILYQEEPPGQEDWQDVPTCLRLHKADCDDLAAWCTAERRVRDGMQDARTAIRKAVRPDGGTLYHVFTQHGPNGPEEDPSRILGMR